MQVKQSISQTYSFFGAFTSPTKLAIIKSLLNEPLNVVGIQGQTNLAQPIISQILIKLRAIGLVKFTKKGTNHFYQLLQPETVRNLIMLVESLAAMPLHHSAPRAIEQTFPVSKNQVMRLHPNEPVFILRAQDVFAPKVITTWCNMVIHDPKATQGNFDQAANASLIANDMEQWQKANPDKVKIPDLNHNHLNAKAA